MKINSILDQFIGVGASSAGKSNPGNWNGVAGGAIAGGLMGVLMGSKGTRKFVGKAATYGGMAVLGGLAYQAFQSWKNSKELPGDGAKAELSGSDQFKTTPDKDLLLDPPNVLSLEVAAVKAMIGASKADGHVDAKEQKRIFEYVESSDLNSEQRRMILDSFGGDVSPHEIAGMINSDEHRAEIYLAAYLAGDSSVPGVRAFLDQLSNALGLPGGFVKHLESQASHDLSA